MIKLLRKFFIYLFFRKDNHIGKVYLSCDTSSEDYTCTLFVKRCYVCGQICIIDLRITDVKPVEKNK